MKTKICCDVFSVVIISFILYVKFSHGLIEMQSDKEKHGMFYIDLFFTKLNIIFFKQYNRSKMNEYLIA